MSNVFAVQFVSRNKDNKGIEGFAQRHNVFLTREPQDSPKLMEKFKEFCAKGAPGETSRFYYSVNARDEEVTKRLLQKYIIEHPDCDICKLDAKITGLAMRPEAAATKHWMFDFDIDERLPLREFCQDIASDNNSIEIDIHKTINGYAVIVNHGFDTRRIMEKWKSKGVELKRDDMLLVAWDKTPEKERELEEDIER